MAASTPRKKKQDVKKLIAESKRAVRTVQVCLRADLVDEYETLQAKLRKLDAGDSLGGHPDAGPITDRLAELRGQMEDATVEFRIQGLARRAYTALVAEHPAREGNKADEMLGMNIDDVVEQLIRRGTIDPVLDDDDWTALLEDALTEATYEALTNAAWSANKRDVSVPF